MALGGIWPLTGIYSPKEPVAVASNPVIKPVPYGTWDQKGQSKEARKACKVLRHSKSGIGLRQRLAILDEEERLRITWIDAVLKRNALSFLGRNGHKADTRLAFMFECIANGPGAECTMTVEEPDGCFRILRCYHDLHFP